MNIITALFILCNFKKFLNPNNKRYFPKENNGTVNNNSGGNMGLEIPLLNDHWGFIDDTKEMNIFENDTKWDDRVEEKKGYSFDVKSNIYLFIDI